VADSPEDLIDEIHGVLKELAELPADNFGGRPWDQFPPERHMDAGDRLRERWQWHFHVLMDKLNWFFRNSTEYRQLEMTTLREQFEWAMFSTASVTRDLLRVKELLQTEAESRRVKSPADPKLVCKRWKEDGWHLRLKQTRLVRDHFQKEAAKECEAAWQTYRRWEGGRRPALRKAIPILRYMGLAVSDSAPIKQ